MGTIDSLAQDSASVHDPRGRFHEQRTEIEHLVEYALVTAETLEDLGETGKKHASAPTAGRGTGGREGGRGGSTREGGRDGGRGRGGERSSERSGEPKRDGEPRRRRGPRSEGGAAPAVEQTSGVEVAGADGASVSIDLPNRAEGGAGDGESKPRRRRRRGGSGGAGASSSENAAPASAE